ncbi:MAG TPA: ABC transporter permease [Niabella sp.]|nr:ABC transporter permease [Niabella sp.]
MMLKLAWKNLLYKPLSTLLCWILLAVSVGIISLLILLQNQFENQFSRTISGIDMVMGAKGSPLQLILSAVYHVDAPTGNIKLEEAEKWMKHPFVEKAIPLAYGDSYKGYSIIGTTKDYLDQYGAVVATGSLYKNNFEVVVGSALAGKLQLKTGSTFYGTHGQDEHGEEHREKAYTVTGVLNPTGSVVDNLIIGNIESVWKIHEHHHEGEAHHAANGHQHDAEKHHEAGEHHHHDEEHETAHSEAEKELTAVLLKFRNPMGLVQLPRIINQQTNMMAAVPAIEVNRLFTLFGVGIDTLKNIAWGIMLLSGLSVFVALFNSLKERKYELALMRTMGAGQGKLVWLVLMEGLLLSMAGIITGLLLSRSALWLVAGRFEKDYHLSVQSWALQLPAEIYLCLLAVLIGLIASLTPAIKAWFINISKTLANG